MEEVKGLIQSRTVWAAIIGLLSLFAPKLAPHLQGIDAGQLAEAGSQVVTAVSLVAAIYYRATASKRIG